MEIRRETIFFSSAKKKKREANEVLIMNDIEMLEKKLSDINDDEF